MHVPNRFAVSKIASDVTQESEHSHDSCLHMAAFVFQIALIWMQFYRAFLSNYEIACHTV